MNSRFVDRNAFGGSSLLDESVEVFESESILFMLKKRIWIDRDSEKDDGKVTSDSLYRQLLNVCRSTNTVLLLLFTTTPRCSCLPSFHT